MYAFDSRVRFSEADHHETITLPGIINYFQDCSIFHSEDIGLGIDYLKEKKRAWVLTSWQIIVDRYPRIGEKIKVGTWATEFNGLYGHRNFCMWDEKGERAACANSIWAFMDLERGRPAKPLPEDIEKLEANVQKLEPVTTMLAKGMTVEQMCEKALEGFTVEKLDEMPVHYACTCSREKYYAALATLEPDELETLPAQDGKVETVCPYCCRKYYFTTEELHALARQVRARRAEADR